MKILTAAALLMIMNSGCWADSLDDAEAKRRGVSVEVVQLENARAQIAALQKQVADLTAQVTSLKKELATRPAESPKVAASGAGEAALRHGMTLDEAKAAFPGTWRMTSETNGDEYYSVYWFRDTARLRPGESLNVEVATAIFSGGKLDTYSIDKTAMAMSGAKPPQTVKAK